MLGSAHQMMILIGVAWVMIHAWQGDIGRMSGHQEALALGVLMIQFPAIVIVICNCANVPRTLQAADQSGILSYVFFAISQYRTVSSFFAFDLATGKKLMSVPITRLRAFAFAVLVPCLLVPLVILTCCLFISTSGMSHAEEVWVPIVTFYIIVVYSSIIIPLVAVCNLYLVFMVKYSARETLFRGAVPLVIVLIVGALACQWYLDPVVRGTELVTGWFGHITEGEPKPYCEGSAGDVVTDEAAVQILTARIDLRSGSVLYAGELIPMRVFSRNAPTNAVLLADASKILGRRVRHPVKYGSPITWADIEPKE